MICCRRRRGLTAAKPLCAEIEPRARASRSPRPRAASTHWILIEYRGLWAHDAVGGSGALASGLKAHLREQRRACPHARLLFVRRPERRSGDGDRSPSSRRVDASRARAPLRSSSSVTTTCSGSTSATAGALRRPPAPPRLHARQARPLLRQVRPPALRRASREQVEDGWVWQSTHVGGDRFAGNLVVLADGALLRARRAGGRLARARRPRSSAASTSPLYRGRSCYGFAAQAAELAVREQTALLGIDDVRVRSIARDGEGWRADVRCGRDGLRGRRARRGGRADPPHLLDDRGSAARGASSQEPLAHEPPDEHEAARVVELAGQLGGAERRLGRDEELELRREPGREAERPALEGERSSRRDRRSRCRAAPARCRAVSVVERPQLARAGRRGSAGGC